MRNTILVRVHEDRMGNLYGAPVAQSHRKHFRKVYGTCKAFAQEGTALRYEVIQSLTPAKRRAVSEGWPEKVLMNYDLFENWIAYHNGI